MDLSDFPDEHFQNPKIVIFFEVEKILFENFPKNNKLNIEIPIDCAIQIRNRARIQRDKLICKSVSPYNSGNVSSVPTFESAVFC